MKARFLLPLSLLAALVFLLMTGTALAASCPYCGQTYGEGPRSDQARLRALRAAHEASCPSRSRSSGGDTANQQQMEEERRAEEERQAAAEAERQAAEAARKAAADAEALRIAAEKKLQAEQKAAEEQAAFERAKERALNSMKRISENELGLRGLDTTGGLGLRSIGDTAPTEASIVDLRHLDPNKPIIIDPNVVKGRPRRILVQPDTFKPTGADYDKGYDELKRHNPVAALDYFKKSLAANPDNLRVINAIDLAQDLVNLRQREAADQRRAARDMAAFATAQLATDPKNAAMPALWLREAYRLSPADQQVRDASAISYGMYLEQLRQNRDRAQQEREEAALALADTSTALVREGKYADAIFVLKNAQAICPGQINIETTLAYLEGYQNARSRTAEKDAQALRKADTAVPHVQAGRYADAIRILKEAQALSPGQSNIENTLAYLEGLEIGKAKARQMK